MWGEDFFTFFSEEQTLIDGFLRIWNDVCKVLHESSLGLFCSNHTGHCSQNSKVILIIYFSRLTFELQNLIE